MHKSRRILEYLRDRDRPWVHTILQRAYQATEMKTAQRLPLDLARRLETEYPSGAESVRRLDETLMIRTARTGVAIGVRASVKSRAPILDGGKRV